MPDGFRIATAYVAIEASDDGFRAQVDAKVKEAVEGTAAKVKLTTDATGLTEKVRADAAAINAEAHVKVKVEDAGLTEKVRADAAAVEAEAHVKVRADATGLVEEVRAEAAAVDAEAHVRVKVEDAGLSEFEAEFRQAMAESDQAVASADADMRRSFTSIESGSRALRAAMADLEPAASDVGRSLDDAGNSADGAGSKLNDAGKKAKSAGNDASSSSSGWSAFASGAKTAGSAALVVSGISLAPALGAIPGLAAGAAAGLGTLAGAFLGVAKAFHDYSAAQGVGGGGISGAQQAATAYSNMVAVRNAEQAISDAETQAARSAVQSAEQIKSAKQGVQDAERAAATAAQASADQITAAQQRVDQAAYASAQAEQSYTNAVYNEQQAQLALVNARQAAANQLVDSQNAAVDAHLSTEQAVLAERQAQTALNAANGNSLMTADQKLAAQLALERATQQVADAKQHELEATQAAATATAAGVDKAPSVLAAQHALGLATQATANAQHGVEQAALAAANAQTALARAQQAAANQQISSAEAVGKAQQQLADAERNAAQQRADAAKTIQRAQQNLTDTIKQQQLAAAAAASSGSTAVNQFAKDMQNLSPAGRAFVNQLISMRGEFHGLSLDAQTATLPGFTQMLKDSQHLLPAVEVGIRNTGKAFSDTAASAGQLFANPQFDAAAMHFTQIVTGGFAQVMSGLPPLLNSIVINGVRAAPLINAVALGIHDILSAGLPAFLSGLNVNAAGAAQGVGALFGAVSGLLGPVGTLVGAASGALGPALANLEPGFLQLVGDIESGLLPIMPQLSTDLADVAQILDQLFVVLEPIIPVISDGLASGLRIVDPLLKATADFLQENHRWLTPVAEGILAVVVAVKAWGLATGAIKSGMAAASSALTKFQDAAISTAGKVNSATSAIGSPAGLAAKLGLVGAITGGVAVGIVAVGTALNKVIYGGGTAATSVDQFTEALLNSESATSDAVVKLDSYAKLGQYIGSNTPGVTDSLAQTGLGMIKLADATGVTTTDLKNYDAALAAMVTNGNGSRAAAVVAQLATATDAHGNKLVDVNKVLPQYSAQLEKTQVDSQASARATGENADAMQQLGMKTQVVTDKFQYMNDSLSRAQALQQFQSQLLNLKDAIDQNGASLDSNSSKGLANQGQFQNLAGAIENYGRQLSNSGDTDGLVALKMQGLVKQLEDQASKYGYNKTQVDAYLKSIGLIPSSVQTTMTTEIQISINQALLEEAAKQAGHVVGHYLVPGQAAGGWVTGPGTGTSDSVLRRLSNGEFVVPADSAAAIGRQGMEQIRNGQIPQVGGTTPQAAAPVINLNYYGSTLPSIEEQQVLMRDLELVVRG